MTGQDDAVKEDALHILQYVRHLCEGVIADLDKAGLSAERSMVDLVHEYADNAIAYIEDPEGFVADEEMTDPDPGENDGEAVE